MRGTRVIVGVLASVSLGAGAVWAASMGGPIGGPATGAVPARRLAPPPRTFSVVAGGDILAESPVRVAAAQAAPPGRRFDFAPLFAPVAPIVAGADLAICHMELPIGSPSQAAGVLGRSPFGGNRLLAPYELAAGAAAAGFDRCSTASNHSYDAGIPGLDTTLAALDAAGLGHTGTARSPAEAEPARQLVDVAGVRVGHLSYTGYSNTVRPAEPWRLNDAGNPAQVAGDVRAARAADAEVVIVSLHVDQELLTAPTPGDRAFVTQLTAAVPVDLVVMHGPHVVQPVERVNGAVVFWSLGNMLSGMGVAGTGRYEDQRTLDGLLAAVRFTEASPGRFTADAWPVLVCVDPATRIAWPGLGAAADRPVLQACASRSAAVVADLR